MEFIKRFKEEDEVHGIYELFSEVFVSRLGKSLGLPVLEVRLSHDGLRMKYLAKKVEDVNSVRNPAQLKRSLPFEEWVLNIDLKQEHVMADEGGNAFIIDHGHSLFSWKPLYYVYEVIGKPVTRFKLWSDDAHYREGVEIVRSIDKATRDSLLRESVNEVLDYKRLDQALTEDYITISSKILDYREKIICSFKN
ncbi:hypothetical protein [Stygiolobus caldivivus]|uniref:Uncharacterized protein n=1 Tax=Stygiolobus caldivivus TaxID=2824673 RepID=A0A8D5U511_9CREN|nr:hypothetical protein [Stygiolobus caldivivus]BCU69581.1 hypothetical protein KN1_08780 [Stygiolobus caldivivus]